MHREPTLIIESFKDEQEQLEDAQDVELDRVEHNSEHGDFPGAFLSKLAQSFAASLGPEPTTYVQALGCSDAADWSKAAREELDAHKLNGTWELADLPPGQESNRL